MKVTMYYFVYINGQCVKTYKRPHAAIEFASRLGGRFDRGRDRNLVVVMDSDGESHYNN